MNGRIPARGLLWMALLLTAGTLAEAAPPPAPEARTVLTVTTVTPETSRWPESLQVNGAIHAWQEAVVAAETGGLAIVSLPVDVGSEVKRGQELLRLSDATVKATLAREKANVARARAGLALAQANGERARAVQGSGALSEQQITQYLLAEESARAELQAAQALQEMEEVRLRQTRVVAADDGVISARNATLGAVVQVGSELFRLVRQGRLEWRAELTASQLARITPGQEARILLSDGQTARAVMRQIAPTLDANSRKGLVYFDLKGASGPIKAGMFAQGEILLGERDALTLPQSAIVTHDGFTYLFVLTAGDQVSRRKITLGRRQDNRVEILSGLEPEMRVVASGGAFLKDGDRVRVEAAKP